MSTYDDALPIQTSNHFGSATQDSTKTTARRTKLTIGVKKLIINETHRRPNEVSTIASEWCINVESLYSILRRQEAILAHPAEDDSRMRLRSPGLRKPWTQKNQRAATRPKENPLELNTMREWLKMQTGLVSGSAVKAKALDTITGFKLLKPAAQRQASRRLVQKFGLEAKTTMFKGEVVPALEHLWNRFAVNTSNTIGEWWSHHRVRLSTFENHSYDTDCKVNAENHVECPFQKCDGGTAFCKNRQIAAGAVNFPKVLVV